MGDSLARSGAPKDLHQALGHFERAVSLNPQLELAWSAMASEHVLLGLYFEAPRDHMPQARQFAERALRINPSLGEAHGSLGLIHLGYDWKPAAAEAEMTAAGAQQAAISTHSCTSHLIEIAGRPRRAEELLLRMLTYDPGSASLIAELGCVDYYRGSYESALRHSRQALEADLRSPVPYWGVGRTLTAEHRYEEALVALAAFKQRNGFEPPLLTAERGYALGSAGRRPEALAVVKEQTERGRHTFIDPYFVALIYASLRDREAALYGWTRRLRRARRSWFHLLPNRSGSRCGRTRALRNWCNECLIDLNNEGRSGPCLLRHGQAASMKSARRRFWPPLRKSTRTISLWMSRTEPEPKRLWRTRSPRWKAGSGAGVSRVSGAVVWISP